MNSMSLPRRIRIHRDRGFSLIEVLVAMLVLGVAVLAFAGLQVRALEGTGVAHTRSQAMTLAAELVERMRTNPSAMPVYRNEGLYDGVWPGGQPETWGATCIYSAVANAGCAAAAMATFDINEMEFLVSQFLPAGRIRMEADCPGTGGPVDCVFVAWGGTDPADCEDNASPNCVVLRVLVQ